MANPPRVLFLAHALGGGGAERITVTLANYLAESGWPVALLPLQTDGHRFPVDARVELLNRAPRGGNRYLRGLRKLRYVEMAIRHFRPDVVVSLGAGFGYLTSPIVRTPFRLVTQISTDPTYLFSLGRSYRVTYARAFKRSDRIVFQTQAALNYFDQPIREKGVIISNPLPGGLVHNPVPFAARDKEVVSFGRLVPQKRFDVLIDAFARFHEQNPEYRLLIFGEGDLRVALQNQIDQLGISDVAELAGFRDDVHERIRNAAIYVLSSDVEGLPNAMLEAMAIGIPCVCTDCAPGGARETIERYGTGVLVPVNNPASLARAMEELVANPQQADELIDASEPLIDLLAGERIYQAWADVIHEIAGRQTAGRTV